MSDYRQQLEDSVSAALELTTKKAAKETVDAVLQGLANILAENAKTKGFEFRTPLGNFKSTFVKEKTARNPSNGEKITVPAKYKVSLKVAKVIADAGKK